MSRPLPRAAVKRHLFVLGILLNEPGLLNRVFLNYSMGKDLEGKPLKPAGQWPGPQSDLLGGRVVMRSV